MTPDQQAELRRIRVAKFDAIYGADEDHAFAEQRPIVKTVACGLGDHGMCLYGVLTHVRCECLCHTPPVKR